MQYDEFVGQVQSRARLATKGEAVAAIRATLETLSERLAGGEVQHVASQFPREIGTYLLHEQAGQGERFSLDEFFRRVTAREREGLELPDAVHHARAVLDVLQEAVSPGELSDILSQLPDEYRALFAAGSEGGMWIPK